MTKYFIAILILTLSNFVNAKEFKLACMLTEKFEHKSGNVDKTEHQAIAKIIEEDGIRFILVNSDRALFSISTSKKNKLLTEVLDSSDENSWEISAKQGPNENGVTRDLSITIDRNTGMLMANTISSDGVGVYISGKCEKVSLNSRKF